MNYNSNGYFKAKAFVASEAFPVSGAVVRIYEGGESISGADFSLRTDYDGITPTISLPAPAKAYSQYPNSPEQSYAVYNVEATAPGFYSKKLTDVAVFSGVLTILPLEMVPDAGISRDVNPPYSTNFSMITENEELE